MPSWLAVKGGRQKPIAGVQQQMPVGRQAQGGFTHNSIRSRTFKFAAIAKRVGPDEPARPAVVVILPDNRRSEDPTAQAEGIWKKLSP